MTKTREKYVVKVLASCITCTSSFDLWMAAHPLIVKVFEVQNTTIATMANQVLN